MPTTASGGTSETAMATPGRASVPVRRTVTQAPATPAAIATPRSSRPGWVRASIDGLGSSGFGMTSETAKPMAMTQTALSVTCTIVRPCHSMRPVASEPPTAMIAPPSGATTIAPMIAATESAYSPNVAMNAAQVSRTTYVRIERR